MVTNESDGNVVAIICDNIKQEYIVPTGDVQYGG